MKYFKFLALLIAPMLILSSCKKSSSVSPAPVPVLTTPGITFKLNGTLRKTDTISATLYSSPKQIDINAAYKNTVSNIIFVIPNIQVGTFDVVKDRITVIMFDSGTTYTLTAGTFNITTSSATSVSGTFQLTGTDSGGAAVNITEGQFLSNVKEQ